MEFLAAIAYNGVRDSGVAYVNAGYALREAKAPASEGGRYKGKKRLADSRGTTYRAPTGAARHGRRALPVR